MAKKIWDKDIDKHVDWGGDESTGGLPVSGRAVQKFIRDTLESKAGYFHYDKDKGQYFVFADEEDCNSYLEDPTQTELIIAYFDAPSNYEAQITLVDTEPVNYIKYGSTGNYIKATFDIIDKYSGESTGDSCTATITLTNGAHVNKITRELLHGDMLSLNVDEYLFEGINYISISILGNTTMASTAIAVTYHAINIILEDETDISRVYNVAEGETSAEFQYHVAGAGLKIVEWYVDGSRVPHNSDEDDITESSSSRTKYISLNELEQGYHSVQFRVGVQVSGEMFYSETHYREIIVNKGITPGEPVAVVAIEFPLSVGILEPGDGLVVYAKQYELLNLRVATWNPDGSYTNTVTVSAGELQLASTVCTEGRESILPITFSSAGNIPVNLSVGESTRSFTLSVAETDMDIHEITNGLELGFSAQGRTNDSENKDSWTDGSHTATFTGFDWIETSGWNNGKLVIPSGASLSFNDYAPLAQDATRYGKTIEIDFKTINVNDDDAVLINLLNNSGVGIQLTATEILVKSKENVTLSRRFKTDENIRISIVINPHRGSTNKDMLFVYFNGIISMAAPFSSEDDFVSSATLSVGGAGAGIVLKQIRIYNRTTLASSAILNNFILYQDTVDDMLTIYDKNDLYENGTNNFDIDKIAAHLPVMIITGNIPAIENTTDKNLQIIADVKYINLQDPTKSFIIKNAIITGQGTSSMTYPKKNLLLYSHLSDQTVMYDYQGNVLQDGLYSFKGGDTPAQPVDRWCLKTDFAESSGTHNTGIARLWNDVLKNTKVNGEYALRTEAQQLAADEHYPYDVRTAIDGFPIVIFYHLSEDRPLVFLGKYNFNNDKSTESVFGFTKFIEDFDNSKVECWEFLDSGNTFALFQTTEGWNDIIIDGSKQKRKWELAWEGRYPNKNKDTTALKTLADWIVSTKDDLQEWIDNKAAHFDLPKLASYYVYLMRHGAVDQTVKNAMLTTEDGEHWYFILYDNDTVHGVRNDGLLRYSPDIDRQSIDPELSRPGDPYYCYAGHGSVLWNNFEADDECMLLAKQIDSALYSAGLTYEKAIEMFNNKQAGMWAEAIYNQDAQYKYIGPWVNQGLLYLGSLQGSRSDHRKWWLSNRYAFFDAFFVNGAYTGKNIHFLAPNAPAGTTFSIVAGKRFYYGYGRDSVVQESGVLLDEGDAYDFTTTQGLEIGTAIRIYAPYNIESLDISEFITYVNASNFDLSAAYDPVLGSKMKRLILGDSRYENNALNGLSGLEDIITLEELNVEGYKAITSLDLSTLINLKKLHASSSGLRSVSFANGAPLELIELPTVLQSLTIKNNANINNFGVVSENNFANIRNMHIENCPKLLVISQRQEPTPETKASIIKIWLSNVSPANYPDCELYVEGLNYTLSKNETNTLYTAMRDLKQAGGNVTLKGKIRISASDNWTEEELNELKELWGDNIFNKNAQLYFYSDTPIVFLSGKSSIHYGDSAQYVPTVIGVADDARYIYRLSSTYQDFINNVELDSNGLLTSTEIIMQVNYSYGTITMQYIGGGQTATITKDVAAYNRIYPSLTNSKLTGDDNNVYKDRQTTFEIAPVLSSTSIDGFYTTVFTATGNLAQYLTLTKVDENHCRVIVNNDIPDIISSGTLVATVTRNLDGVQCCELTFDIYYQDSTIAISSLRNPHAVRVLKAANLCASADYVLKSEAENITDAELTSTNATYKSIFNNDSLFRSGCNNFDELKYFTLLTKVPDLRYCGYLTSIQLPPNILTLSIQNTYFTNNIYVPSSVSLVNIKGSRILGLDMTDFEGYVDYQGFYDIILENLVIGSNTKFRSLGGPPLENGMANYLKNVLVYPGNAYFAEGVSLYSPYNYNTLYYLAEGDTIPSETRYIGQYACYRRYAHTLLSLNNTESIGQSSFYECEKLKQIVNCDNLSNIRNNAFKYCRSLESIDAMPNLKTVGAAVFESTHIKTLIIGDRLTTLQDYAFENMAYLESVTIMTTTPPTTGQSIFYGDSALTAIYVPAEAVEDYKIATGWSDYASLIQAIPEE